MHNYMVPMSLRIGTGGSQVRMDSTLERLSAVDELGSNMSIIENAGPPINMQQRYNSGNPN